MKKISKETEKILRKEIDVIAQKMSYEDDPEELRLLKERYEVLSKMLETSWKVSPDTLLIVGANLLGIILILKYEKLDIISSRAINFVMKGRV